MSKISDEIRKFADEYDVFPLYTLADRIDRELVELPKDRDGVPIHVGDAVRFVGRDDVELKVDHIKFFKDKAKVYAMSERHAVYSNSADFTHERPDSWERIARDIEEPAFSDCEDTRRERREIADRIRKLAEKEDER